MTHMKGMHIEEKPGDSKVHTVGLHIAGLHSAGLHTARLHAGRACGACRTVSNSQHVVQTTFQPVTLFVVWMLVTHVLQETYYRKISHTAQNPRLRQRASATVKTTEVVLHHRHYYHYY